MQEKDKQDLKLTDKVKFDSKGGSILGILEGPIADFINPTRNGRKYTNKLWKKVFGSSIVQEMFENGGIPGELDHPVDRDEIDSTKIAVLMPEPPVEETKTGLYNGRFYILDTPCGRIVHTLAKAGFKLGISSRGNGDVEQDFDGNESVNEDTYDFKCFDVVLIPSVEPARMKLVTESLSTKKFDYKKALRESIEKANEEERVIMKKTLEDLNIKLDDEKETPETKIEASVTENGYTSEKTDNKLDTSKKEDSEKSKEASDTGLEETVKNLQEALKKNFTLENEIQNLQSKLAVSDTKVTKINEELARYKAATVRLSNVAVENKKLLEKVSVSEKEVAKQKQLVEKQKAKIQELTESRKKENSTANSLQESLRDKDSKINQLVENLNKQKTEAEETAHKLNEQLENVKADSEIKKKEYNKKLTESANLVKKYRTAINETLNRYIDSKARMLGVSSNRIKNELAESYTIDDIDKVCESLQEHYVSMSKLPFNLTKDTKGKVTESKNDNLQIDSFTDDDVDDSLYRLANLDK